MGNRKERNQAFQKQHASLEVSRFACPALKHCWEGGVGGEEKEKKQKPKTVSVAEALLCDDQVGSECLRFNGKELGEWYYPFNCRYLMLAEVS